jgi:hypothetical protein
LSGWRDLNSRLLDPQADQSAFRVVAISCIIRRFRWSSGQWCAAGTVCQQIATTHFRDEMMSSLRQRGLPLPSSKPSRSWTRTVSLRHPQAGRPRDPLSRSSSALDPTASAGSNSCSQSLKVDNATGVLTGLGINAAAIEECSVHGTHADSGGPGKARRRRSPWRPAPGRWRT